MWDWVSDRAVYMTVNLEPLGLCFHCPVLRIVVVVIDNIVIRSDPSHYRGSPSMFYLGLSAKINGMCRESEIFQWVS